MKSINPNNNKLIKEYPEHSLNEVKNILQEVDDEWQIWKNTSFSERSYLIKNVAKILRNKSEYYAKLITSEMGKIIKESKAEIEKCVWLCEYYDDNAEKMLQDELIPTNGQKSFVTFEPLGTVFAIMPWNFPFWQVLRFCVPTLMAGNTAVLKHSSNVPGCALAIEDIFVKAGFPANVFRSLMIRAKFVESVIASDYIKAVTITGGLNAGSKVAAQAGKYLKKSVLELGGSDPYIVLNDAEINKSCATGTFSRMLNAGQVCISAKRFIVEEGIAGDFIEQQKNILENMIVGDPMKENTQMGPLAQKNLLDTIDKQVQQSIKMGAELITGGKRINSEGFFYQPTLLTNVKKGMPVVDEETFGPISVIIRVKNTEEAIKIANDTMYGLGASIWTKDIKKGEEIARKIEAGAVFVNGMTKSDPRLPFGGIKKSGYGRELSSYGIKEFLNIKTIWIG